MAGDWKRDLGKIGGRPIDSGQQKKCKTCGKTLKPDSKYDACFECGKKNKEVKEGASGLPQDYIEKLGTGYFDKNKCLWEEFITTMASSVALSFGNCKNKLNNHQLRRFYTHTKAAENRLKMTNDWPCVNVDIKKTGAFAAEAKGKGKIPDSFYDFIDKNMKLIKTKEDFEAFLEHFQAVVAYFTYHYPRN